MPDSFNNWQRPTGPKRAPSPMEVKWRAIHSGMTQKRRPNPHKEEAHRDRIIFFISGFVLVVIFLVIYAAKFMSR